MQALILILYNTALNGKKTFSKYLILKYIKAQILAEGFAIIWYINIS